MLANANIYIYIYIYMYSLYLKWRNLFPPVIKSFVVQFVYCSCSCQTVLKVFGIQNSKYYLKVNSLVILPWTWLQLCREISMHCLHEYIRMVISLAKDTLMISLKSKLSYYACCSPPVKKVKICNKPCVGHHWPKNPIKLFYWNRKEFWIRVWKMSLR